MARPTERALALEQAANLVDGIASEVRVGLKNKLIDPAGMFAAVADDIRALEAPNGKA